MPVPKDDESEETPLSERLLDLLVFIPAGLAVTAVDELPKLAARGRERMGVRVSSARAVGQFAVKAGQSEFRRRSSALRRRDQGASEVLGDEEPEVADVPRPTPKTPRVTDAHRSAGTESVAAERCASVTRGVFGVGLGTSATSGSSSPRTSEAPWSRRRNAEDRRRNSLCPAFTANCPTARADDTRTPIRSLPRAASFGNSST